MAYITWVREWNTGISAIDRQHRRIVQLINDLYQAQGSGGTREVVEEVLNDLIDYIATHFVFEEELQVQSGYPFANAHRRLHQMFTEKVMGYKARFVAGEDIVGDLVEMLEKWLENHINIDDVDYAPLVKEKLFSDRDTTPPWLALVPD